MATDPRPILKAGLTGGIASGKSTVSAMLAELGAFVIDADRLAHEVMDAGGSAHEDVVERFGPGILDEQGRIDRPKLAGTIFHDREARETLNAIVHPRVRAEAEARIARYHEDGGHAPVAVFEAALLVESGAWRDMDRMIVVRCSKACQLRRLISRDGIDADEARARIAAQAPLEDKLKVAHYVIDTERTIHDTREQTERVWGHLLEDLEREFGEPRH